MRIARIHINLIRLPFRVSYGHKQKMHKDVFAVLCCMEDEQGHIGLGESVPRTYVTGETAESAFRDAQSLARQLLGKDITSREEAQNLICGLAADWGAPFPSCAFCCIDLALHDCLAQSQEKDMGRYLGAEIRPLPYTGSIGLGGKAKLLALLALYRISGIRSFKLKVGDEYDGDRLKIIRNFMGQDAPVFADANGAWSMEEAPEKINDLAKYGVWAIEEPLRIPMPSAAAEGERQSDRDAVLQDAHFEQYAQLRREISMPVILDETLISPRSFQKIVTHQAADILNMRLSKLGGYSLVAQMLAEKPPEMKFSFGAMVGESPVLAAAGYFLGCAYSDHLYIQGYSHRILHGTQFVQGGPSMKHGKVCAHAAQTGLGLTLKTDILKKLTLKEEELTHGKT
ncbi:MAG: hypothetical protein EP349_03820 [Alphaproteobacteria bacterium]|nr:MAG: hypothetical protein EP349_03820 [Alphaproteobacteria bacterium]